MITDLVDAGDRNLLKLEGAEQIDIAPQRTDIGKAMWRIADAIDTDPRACGFGDPRDGFYIINGPDHIGTMRKTDQSCIITQQLHQIIGV